MKLSSRRFFLIHNEIKILLPKDTERSESYETPLISEIFAHEKEINHIYNSLLMPIEGTIHFYIF